MSNAIKTLTAAIILGLGGLTSPTVDAGQPVCRDSNGSRPGGSVYVVHNQPVGCDVVPPQRLHVVRVPNRAECNELGGRYTSVVRICWDVDY